MTHGIDIDSWHRQGLMVHKLTHGIDMDSCDRHGLMELTTGMVLTQTHGIVLVLLNNTRKRGQSAPHMTCFFYTL